MSPNISPSLPPLSLSPFLLLSRSFDTDNGAFYYYNPEKNKTYEDTLMDVYDYENRYGERHQQCVLCAVCSLVCHCILIHQVSVSFNLSFFLRLLPCSSPSFSDTTTASASACRTGTCRSTLGGTSRGRAKAQRRGARHQTRSHQCPVDRPTVGWSGCTTRPGGCTPPTTACGRAIRRTRNRTEGTLTFWWKAVRLYP